MRRPKNRRGLTLGLKSGSESSENLKKTTNSYGSEQGVKDPENLLRQLRKREANRCALSPLTTLVWKESMESCDPAQ